MVYICNIVAKLSKRDTIRQIVSFLLLGVFAFSITPKKVLHNWIANHTDQAFALANVYSAKNPGTTALKVAGFHCNTDNLVTESPFEIGIEPENLLCKTIYTVDPLAAFTSLLTQQLFYSELRGPPIYIVLPA